MGGTTQTVDKNQAANSLVNSSGSTSGATSGATSASGTTNPWVPAQPFLSGILAQLQGQLANTSLTPQENAAIGGLAGSSGISANSCRKRPISPTRCLPAATRKRRRR